MRHLTNPAEAVQWLCRRVSVTEEGERLVVRVADTGCGIPDRYRESIF